jgi:N-acetylmuramic acid 6-phosphate etherase
VALLADGAGQPIKQLKLGPANLQFLSDKELIRHFQSIRKAMPSPTGLAVGLAGAWAESDQNRIRIAAAKVWPGVPCIATHDLETALRAADADSSRQVLVISGTGSGCYGKAPGDRPVKIGGWGHVLGDKGSGYDIGLSALQAVILEFDRSQRWPVLGQRILRALELNEPDDLIGWAQSANKAAIAGLAIEVFAAWAERDRLAHGILVAAAKSLAQAASICGRRIAGSRKRVSFVLSGSILLKQPRFGALVGREIRRLRPHSKVAPLGRESVWGAVELARLSVLTSPSGLANKSKQRPHPGEGQPLFRDSTVRSAKLSPTEARNPRSTNLDRLSGRKAVRLMLTEEVKVPRKLLDHVPVIERVVEAIVRTFKRGGRLFYVGAGTSGRLGVLDASECPPTFRTQPDLVQAIIAGGQTAIWNSVEGAEDDAPAGERAVNFRGVGARDLVLGIAASGTTPFVWGALRMAKSLGATTVLLCFNPYLQIPANLEPDFMVAPNLGPELLTGSTRLKAGTATKLLLNLFTTLAMVRSGKVMSNLMVDLHPANVKLRDRAVRIVQALTQAELERSRKALEVSGWNIRGAVARLRRKATFRAREISLAGTRQ